jgi:thiamine biosynthesis protein ThiS
VWFVKAKRNKPLQVIVNGESREVPEHSTVATLVDFLSLPVDRTAIERNREVVRRGDWPQVQLADGDRIEIVHLVGGG